MKKHNIAIIDDDRSVQDELQLTDADFPISYVNMAHPDDYKISSSPIDPDYIFHKEPHHNCLILRISWKTDDGFLPMSFVCDTSALMHFYLSPR